MSLMPHFEFSRGRFGRGVRIVLVEKDGNENRTNVGLCDFTGNTAAREVI